MRIHISSHVCVKCDDMGADLTRFRFFGPWAFNAIFYCHRYGRYQASKQVSKQVSKQASKQVSK